MDTRSAIGSLQLPIAGLGGCLCVSAALALLSLPPSSDGSDGFLRGLAMLVVFVIAWAGFLITAIGLAIPPGPGIGIHFNRWQRRLFGITALLSVLSLVAPLVFWTVVATTGLSFGSAAMAWLGFMVLAGIAFVTSIGWRITQVIATHLRDRNTSTP